MGPPVGFEPTIERFPFSPFFGGRTTASYANQILPSASYPPKEFGGRASSQTAPQRPTQGIGVSVILLNVRASRYMHFLLLDGSLFEMNSRWKTLNEQNFVRNLIIR